jgi:hypothetical protein
MRAMLSLLLLAGLLAAAPVVAQRDPASGALRTALADYARDEGNPKLIDTVKVGQLKLAHDGVHEFTIQPLIQYVILAVSEDVGEVSLLVATDEEDGVVWEDYTNDPGPKVEIHEQERSRITVTVQMDDCGKPACLYALGVYKVAN